MHFRNAFPYCIPYIFPIAIAVFLGECGILPMEINGIQWNSLEINGSQWETMGIDGNQWESVEINGNQWKSMEVKARPLNVK